MADLAVGVGGPTAKATRAVLQPTPAILRTEEMIRTARLDLVPVEPSDAQAALSGQRRSDWAGDYPTEGDLVIARHIADNPASSPDAYVPYKIILRASGQVIGGCGFLGPPDATGSVEIGYGLAPSQRGKGIATEAVNGLVDEAWGDPFAKLVFALTDENNEPSQGVLRRAGFRQVDSDTEQLRWEMARPVDRLKGSDPGAPELTRGTSGHALRERFAAIEPYDQGVLDVGDGQRIYWEVSGNPSGKPAVALHGGPGSGSSPGRRRSFDPDAYRFVQFDQRGCGRSTPSAGDVRVDLATNTTEHLISDIERLREHLGIDRWLVWGGSWGVTLGLAYAERHPERVSEMVLVSVTLTRPSDVHWLYHEAGRFFPEQWARFREGGGNAEDLVAAYDRLLNAHPDPAVRVKAAQDWCDWEDAVVSLEDGWTPNPRYADPGFRMTFARLCAHYFSHAAWLGDGALLHNAARLTGIPGVLIHGRLDLGGPPDVPWLLAQAWPDAELHLVGTGHTGGVEMTERMMAALDRFARR